MQGKKKVLYFDEDGLPIQNNAYAGNFHSNGYENTAHSGASGLKGSENSFGGYDEALSGGIGGGEQPYVRSARKNPRHIKWGRILFVLFFLAAAVCVGVIIVAQGGKYVKQKTRTFYFLQLGEFASAAECTQKSEQIKITGGAGFVYNDGSYRVMAAVYLNKTDADTVAARLNTEGQTATVFLLTTATVKYAVKDDPALSALLAEAMNYPLELMQELYNISVRLDTAEISESLATLQIGVLKANTEKRFTKISAKQDKMITLLKRQYADILVLLDNACDLTTKVKITSKIKYALCALAQNIHSQTLEEAKL